MYIIDTCVCTCKYMFIDAYMCVTITNKIVYQFERWEIGRGSRESTWERLKEEKGEGEIMQLYFN